MSSWSVKEGNCVAQSCPQTPDSSGLRGRSVLRWEQQLANTWMLLPTLPELYGQSLDSLTGTQVFPALSRRVRKAGVNSHGALTQDPAPRPPRSPQCPHCLFPIKKLREPGKTHFVFVPCL